MLGRLEGQEKPTGKLGRFSSAVSGFFAKQTTDKIVAREGGLFSEQDAMEKKQSLTCLSRDVDLLKAHRDFILKEREYIKRQNFALRRGAVEGTSEVKAGSPRTFLQNISESARKTLVAFWEQDSDMKYTNYRTETSQVRIGSFSQKNNNLIELHGTSFIKEVIPGMVVKKPGQKIRVLDVGAGQGLYAEQMRIKCRGKVDVDTTGLTDMDLHRSILEFTSADKKDLIIDSYGEFFYTTNNFKDQEKKEKEILGVNFEAMENYLDAVCNMLEPGGVCSVAPFRFLVDPGHPTGDDLEIRKIFSRLEQVYGVSFSREQAAEGVLKIVKPNIP